MYHPSRYLLNFRLKSDSRWTKVNYTGRVRAEDYTSYIVWRCFALRKPCSVSLWLTLRETLSYWPSNRPNIIASFDFIGGGHKSPGITHVATKGPDPRLYRCSQMFKGAPPYCMSSKSKLFFFSTTTLTRTHCIIIYCTYLLLNDCFRPRTRGAYCNLFLAFIFARFVTTFRTVHNIIRTVPCVPPNVIKIHKNLRCLVHAFSDSHEYACTHHACIYIA